MTYHDECTGCRQRCEATLRVVPGGGKRRLSVCCALPTVARRTEEE